MGSPTWKSPCGNRICFPTPRLFMWVRSVKGTSLACSFTSGLVLPSAKAQTSSAQSWPSDTHLLKLASLQVWGWFSSGISRIQPTQGFSEICCWKAFRPSPSLYFFANADSLPISRALCMNNAAWPPSGLPSHSCLLMPALLRASCWDLVILQTLKPLQLFHHSMPAPSLLLHLSRSDCQRCQSDWLTIFTAWTSISFKVENSASTATSTAAGPVAVSATLLNTTFSGILPGSSSSVLGSRYLDISPEWH